MRIEEDVKLDYKDVLIRPKRSILSSRKEVDLNRKFKFRNYEPDFPENIEESHYSGIPIMAANMDGVGTFEMADTLSEQGIFTCLVKTYTVEELIKFYTNNRLNRTNYVAMSIGITDTDLDKLHNVYAAVAGNLKFICVDVANGYTERFANTIRKLRVDYPHLIIIAGNVVTGEMTEELILSGADIVKVGIGPGSVCTTRIQTGVGYPQLSAIIECADAAHGLGGHIIADGGCTCPGDIAKAFGAGADFVMLGGMLSGHKEGGGQVIEEIYETNQIIIDPDTNKRLGKLEEKKQFVQFYGMSSDTAMEKHHGGVAEYRSSEGRTVKVPYKGPVAKTVQDILGGVRSTCTYVGAKSLKDLSKCTTFVRVNKQYNSVFVDKR
jgi:GMP reductase